MTAPTPVPTHDPAVGGRRRDPCAPFDPFPEPPAPPLQHRRPVPGAWALVAVSVVSVVSVVAVLLAVLVLPELGRSPHRGPNVQWPARGQAAVDVSGLSLTGTNVTGTNLTGTNLTGTSRAGTNLTGTSRAGTIRIGSSGDGRPVPIASLAKVMTAYVVLREYPLRPGRRGFSLTISAQDVADTAARRERGESVVTVRAGERLTERQALTGLLLPSANNLAADLAVRVSGSRAAFVAGMNAEAARLGMSRTTYTDPSGYDEGTVSTASDQTVLAEAALRVPALAALVRLRSAVIPVAGRVTNTDTLLGTGGFRGMKTGSDAAAGGCFMFTAVRTIHGRQVTITGVVLGQRGHRLVLAGLKAAAQLVDGTTTWLAGAA